MSSSEKISLHLGITHQGLQLILTLPRRCRLRAMNERDDDPSVRGQPARRTGVCWTTLSEAGRAAARSSSRHSALEKVHWTFSPPSGSRLIHQNQHSPTPAAHRDAGQAGVGQTGGGLENRPEMPAPYLGFRPPNRGTGHRGKAARRAAKPANLAIFPIKAHWMRAYRQKKRQSRPVPSRKEVRAWPRHFANPVVFAARRTPRRTQAIKERQ